MPLYDLKGDLVLPWEQRETFRKGTFVMVEAHLNVHHFPQTGKGYNVRIHFTSRPDFSQRMVQTYQIIASKVRVVGELPDPYEPPVPTTDSSLIDVFDKLAHIIEETTEDMDTPNSATEVDEALVEDGKGTLKRHHAK